MTPLLKDFMEHLEKKRIRMLACKEDMTSLDVKISETCRMLSLPPRCEGTKFLTTALKLILDNKFYDEKSAVYAVAEAFDVTVDFCMHEMNRVVEHSWFSMEPRVLEKVFSKDVEWHKVPDNERYLKCVATYISSTI